ncbi:MAG: hypothetical protein QW756_00975 [Nitrososphaerota archaeon]
MVGEKIPEEFVKPLDAVERYGIKFVNKEILQIDPVNRRVRTANKVLEAEHIVVALGAELAPE